MATASQSAFCPKCGGELPVARTSTCPHCNAQLIAPTNRYFGSPDYLWHQKETLLDQYDSSRPTAKVKSIDLEKVKDIELSITEWVRDCPFEDKIAALRDAQAMVSNALHAKLAPQEIQKITAIAKAIGRMGQAIDEYFKSGGQIYDRKVGRVQAWTEDEFGGHQATR